MAKLILIMICIFILTGCTPKIKTVYQDVVKPVLVCPAPSDIPRPDLMIHGLKPPDVKDPGKVVQHYKASMLQLLNYVQLLELNLQQYDKNSHVYKDLQKEFDTWEKIDK